MPEQPKKILLVDDDYMQRDLYQHIFTDNGFEVITADNGQDAWKQIQKTPVDLLFTGIDMPHLDGFGLLKKFREKKESLNIPAIVFSHLGRPEDQIKAKAFYNVHFLVKGYDTPDNILKKVKDLLKSGHNTPPEQPFDLPAPDTGEDNRPGRTAI